MHEIFLKYDGLTPILEEDDGFELALHQRNFLAGRTIMDNIVKHILESRRMIVLLSRS